MKERITALFLFYKGESRGGTLLTHGAKAVFCPWLRIPSATFVVGLAHVFSPMPSSHVSI